LLSTHCGSCSQFKYDWSSTCIATPFKQETKTWSCYLIACRQAC